MENCSSHCSWLSTREYYELLRNKEEELCSKVPAVKPKPGHLYIYDNPENPKDWLADQLRWRDNGTALLPRGNPLLKCTYFRTYHGTGFSRRAIQLADQPESPVLVHYVGSEENKIDLPHGNAKGDNARPYHRSAKSLLDKEKASVNMNPQKTYIKILQDEIDCEPKHEPVFRPRDKKQVQNTVYRERENRLPAKDDILGLHEIESELGVVYSLKTLPEFYSIICSSGMSSKFLEVAALPETILMYDTTFNLGDFYLSTLTYTNGIFAPMPTVPLAYVLHHRKTESTHSSVFFDLRKKFPILNKMTIVTDREQSIINAIKSQLPEANHVFCWNHIQQDIKYWLRNRSSTKEDILVYVNHIWDLLDSNTNEELDEKYTRMSPNWTESFKSYFDKFVIADIRSSAKCNLQKLGIYQPGSGITINRAESFNALLKRFTDHKEVKLQVMVLSLYHLDLHFQKEILRGQARMGSYHLSPRYEHFEREVEDIQYPASHLPLDKIPYCFNTKDVNSKDAYGEHPFTNFAIARQFILENRITLVPDQQLFVVRGFKQNYVVSLYPQETCSCKLKTCVHIRAAKLSVGDSQPHSKKIKLSDRLRKARSKKAGKKGPQDLTLVEAAEDSEILSRETSVAAAQTVLIPTSIGKNIIKKRFLDPKNSSNISFTEVMSSTRLTRGNMECTNSDQEDEPAAKLTTPSKNRIETANPTSKTNRSSKRSHTGDVINISSDVENEDKAIVASATDTFDEKMAKDRCFMTFGIVIYPHSLECLSIPQPKEAHLRFLSESTIELYLSAKIHERTRSRAIFCTDGNLLSSQNFILNTDTDYMPSVFKYAVTHKLVERKVLLIPIVERSHCTLLISHMESKSIYYLNSLKQPGHGDLFIRRFLTLIHIVSKEYYGKDFDFSGWTMYEPSELLLQKNGYDCGVYSCLFGDLIIDNSAHEVTQFKITDFRKTIRDKLVHYMEKPVVERYRFHVKRLKLDLQKYDQQQIMRSIDLRAQDFKGVLRHLGSIINGLIL